MKSAWVFIASIDVKDGKLPEWILLFKAGWGEVEGSGKFLVDRESFELLAKYIARRGNDIVYDYEHQTVAGVKAPAAGWLKKIRFDEGVGIMAQVEWTDEAAGYIEKKEYRYFSPVFFTRKSDKRVIAVHSVALTNAPKTNHLTPLLAKLGAQSTEEETAMKFLQKLIAKLGLADGAGEDDVLTAMAKIMDKAPEVKEVIAKDVLDALDLKEEEDISVVVASIHALKQGEKGMVSKAEFDKLKKDLAHRDADEIVAKALADGKITPDQKDWAREYAARDLKGFATFVAKAPVVVPIDELPGKKDETDAAVLTETVKTVAKLMDVSEEDIKKYGG